MKLGTILVAAVAMSLVGLGGCGKKDGAAGGGGGVCGKAVACCKAIVAKGAPGMSAASCDPLNQAGVPEATCQASLTGYQASAKALGVTCE
jgi:hypothetical protein